jgi:hypothetical protein
VAARVFARVAPGSAVEKKVAALAVVERIGVPVGEGLAVDGALGRGEQVTDAVDAGGGRAAVGGAQLLAQSAEPALQWYGAQNGSPKALEGWFRQAPSEPARLQALQLPSQLESQQTPSTQWPLKQRLAAAQAASFSSFGTQASGSRVPSHQKPLAQLASELRVAGQLCALPSQRKGEQDGAPAQLNPTQRRSVHSPFTQTSPARRPVPGSGSDSSRP